MHTTLASILHQADLISSVQQQQVEDSVSMEGITVPSALIHLGIFSDRELAQHLSHIFGLTLVSVHDYDFEACCKAVYQRDLVLRHRALPLYQSANTLFLGVSDPCNIDGQDEFRFATGRNIEPLLLENKQLESAIRRIYGRELGETTNMASRDVSDDDLNNLVDIGDEERDQATDLGQENEPVTRYINQVLLDAVRKKASDIHFEPYETSYRIRFRCDGILHQHATPPAHLSRRLSTRLKVMSRLNIAERRQPQDGRIKLKLTANLAVDLRVSTLPTLWGEKVVLRILDSSSANLDIDILGYNQQQKAAYLNALQQPQGMILMTGPTGSGKTVSLYTGLSILNTEERNISTAEDPVEINLPGINQVHINNQAGLGFAEALRSFLRQDPDVVMVGEIRDLETASIAVKAAQTGHLVLSTLHTNSAAETITRLTNMGIEDFNLASSLTLIIAQRLGRRLCPHCKQVDEIDSFMQDKLRIPAGTTLYKANPEGCDDCNKGYLGRVGIYEVMPFSRRLAQALVDGATTLELENIAVEEGMLTLQQSGIEKLCLGITSLKELQRVLHF
ncbi:type IV-A pilus assembly ATPase PilB [Photobacterium damselae subsp. damselae]|uniref:type IV-A pilus assembly ATPase PilB n=1 Tax=Photobacterium damselae TaxID=38293 RepID=UPI0010FF0680|nr:type IV-A pilus assembly ATPase PilB [Photobacterium damselae]TLS84433.1 type IV-A pilus assembly ATPase PilB [Photobacterium damselae subsp. damselae]TLS91375.1 type IV-A pilus assembly ATPase PilB [Photobacterium damselae subsp. damselae]